MVTAGIPEYGSAGLKLVLSLLPATGFNLTLNAYFAVETNSQEGLTWNSLQVVMKDYTVGNGILFLFLSFWFWLFIYYYADQVLPWHDVGVPRKPWFLFLPAYWREVFGMKALPISTEADTGFSPSAASDMVEDESDPAHVQLIDEDRCVVVRSLNKTFTNLRGAKVQAVHDLNLTMYEGECFCLLGHNGAGKTTAMLMITGCLPQSSGNIIVKGHSIPEQVRAVRSSIGFCPQHNILWDELTVEEHIHTFGRIGGMTLQEASARGESLLSDVSLLDKRYARTSTLSGGMKRKLSCVLAFLTKPYLVILDEPSSGMDPFARRGMWDTLKSWRSGHILCLTTHYMDEADALGDRIAIMSQGHLACSGSSTFLKTKFGCGYILSFVKLEDSESSSADTKIVELVRNSCGPQATIMSAVGRELLVQIPFSSAHRFSELFPTLDANLQAFGIESYGMSVTSLEEVFLKVADRESDDKANPAEEVLPSNDHVNVHHASFAQQLNALTIRRAKYAMRNKTMLCCNIAMPPVCLLLICLLLAGLIVIQLPPLKLDTSSWNLDTPEQKVPITVATGGNSPATPAARAAYSARMPPGVSAVHFQASLQAKQSPPPSTWMLLPQGYERWAGIVQESAFLDNARSNGAQTAETQYGALFYPNESSWGGPLPPGVTVMSNLSATHGPAVMFNVHAGASLAMRDGGVKRLEVVNHPFEYTTFERQGVQFLNAVLVGIMVMGAFAFVPAGIVGFIAVERERDVKHQLTISGCSLPAYWLSNLLFDFLMGCIPVAGAMAVFAIYDMSSYCEEPGVGATVVLLVLFILASTGFSYVMSFMFQKAGSAIMVAWILNLSFGFVCQIVLNMLLSFPDPSVRLVGVTLRVPARLVPMYNLGSAFLSLATKIEEAKTSGISAFSGPLVGGMQCDDPPFDFNGEQLPLDVERDCLYMVGDEVFMLALDALIFFALALAIDILGSLPQVKQYLGMKPPLPQNLVPQEDDMVKDEKERVQSLDPTSQFVWVNNVRKSYNFSSHAVRGISFACAEGQVFGLLGVNGAGKTTTFKMLCGQIEPTEGNVCIRGMDVAADVHKVRKFIGYCPQFDALLDCLTVEEHLYLYGRVKGLSGVELKSAVEMQLKELDLSNFRSSCASKLSGGNKRKLSVGIATISEPPMVFLDEPSAGMDPVARRSMWKVVQNIAERRKKSVVILTTHSMDEAEALCSRIAIQVDGWFRCLGSAQQIKSRYGQGLELNIRLVPPTREEINACCQTAGVAASEILTVSVASSCLVKSFGEDAVNKLHQRRGCLVSTSGHFSMLKIIEECLLEFRVMRLESWLTEELSSETADENVTPLICLEKNGTVLRYRIVPEALGGRFKSLGALFELLQERQAEEKVEDFQISQTSLEQIFNHFAAAQTGLQTAQPTTYGRALADTAGTSVQSAPRTNSAGTAS
eukprot:TRINITY_DN16131_c0_g1_i3.p1 TRINITY_DN16131_c0_g1~~TRINITY_DN16131_c0_g1_i3.p1  ORF type:complete len:1463 (-),score=263.39 TRINITY_DN16131_c0_g1_i3:88-4389(-)